MISDGHLGNTLLTSGLSKSGKYRFIGKFSGKICRKKDLDTSATDLASRQDESDASRKRLVEQSRDFKKNTPEDIRKVVAPLLKSFQGEIDALSKRSKAAEAAFLSVYKKLIDIPDPVQVLEHALLLQKRAHKAQDLEIENKQLRETLDEYNHEFAEVKNQEVTIKQLKEKLKEHEEKVESTAQARAKEKERELQRLFAEKERQLQETQMDVARKLGEAEHKVSTLQSALDNSQSELFDLKSKYDETTTAKSDETEMVMADLERANERAAAAERMTEKLKKQLDSATQNLQHAEQMQQAPDMEQAIDILKRSSLEVELAAKEKEISQLVEDVQRLQNNLTKLRDSTSTQIAKLEEELSAKNRAFKTLEEKMKSQEDYEEIKRELGILKSIEFSNMGEESAASSGEQAKPKSLEMLLLEKNRALQTENTQMKMAANDLTGTSTPPLSTTEAFASIIGQEIAASYCKGGSESQGETASVNPESPASSSARNSPPVNGDINVENGHAANGPTTSPGSARPNGPIPQELLLNGIVGYKFNSRQQIDINNSSSLDTAEVALRIREILSSHNIGQRLFAKHVLGLSQGTVSELLSKPKHWDKLTEKGRESYRKMSAWASDERNVYALKAISPKKGGQPLMSSSKVDDAATEEKISKILSEAQQAMQSKQAAEQFPFQAQITNAMVQSIYQQELARMAQGQGRESPKSPRSKSREQMERDMSISQEIVTRIYQEELAKLAYAAQRAGNIAECTMYQQELSRLAQNAQKRQGEGNGDSPDNLSIKVKAEPMEDDGQEQALNMSMKDQSDNSPNSSSEENMRHAGSAFFLVRPRSNSYDPASYNTDAMSPLQRMQSIANSLSLNAQAHNLPQKPLRPVLPPITQEEFDKYSNLNTDELVKKVKDSLSQFSISQRLFGENVLGLSQGSVSDLLARPKPWHMLTQKGREPFIRMQIFLKDKESIPRLVANQYKIAPEKLMRTHGSYGPYPPNAPEAFSHTTNSQQPPPAHTPLPPSNPIIPSSKVPEAHRASLTSSPMVKSGHQPSVYEIAAMTTELDTLAVTSKIKEVLLFHNLGQKLFGEAILGLSQGSVSELLSKPKPWHMLSLKGREPFIKMQMWLNDPQGVERLRIYQNEIRASRKRKGSNEADRHSEGSTGSTGCNTSGKKPRVFFSDEQKEALKVAYAQDPYPNQNTIEFLAQELNVHSKTIINWFHNHRMRAKQQRPPSRNTPQLSYQHVKTELTDEASNLSDASNNSNSQIQYNNNSSRETSQWLFPAFEPVGASDNCRTPNSEANSDDVGSVSEQGDVALEQGNNRPRREASPNENSQTARPSVNKRKSSNPQRAYQGVQLDKTVDKQVESDKDKVVELDATDESEQMSNDIQERNNNKNSLPGETEEEKIKRLEKIQLIKKKIESSDLDWEEVDRKESIEKLEKNLEKDPPQEEEWEF
ncbi:homeobox protein cut-like 1 isoform X2 [Lingula anatina]|uniref:Homeobox protein cut-like n=1 Tax=Lingula anatina TaxID=7574 RepID=A0A1S3K1K9_LINAN|nr:homeobox protein cut-like 1 isoform X2 [Lingula anatina]|eukprot:XP_013416515.1 homeobox protein cut-like 1 isoform X2 [Lingula anatina]